MNRAQSAIEYSFVIAIVAITFLAIQTYLARGMQGHFQTATDQMSDQYGQGVSNVHEHSQADARVWEITFPGFGSPTTKTYTKGSSDSSSTRKVSSLDKNWP